MRGGRWFPTAPFPRWTVPIIMVLAGYVWVRQKTTDLYLKLRRRT